MTRGRPSRQSIYDRLDEAIDDLRTRMGGLPSPAEAEEIWGELWHQEAHHSTALEGNTLILDEVRKLLDEGRTVGSKSSRSTWRFWATPTLPSGSTARPSNPAIGRLVTF